jgi:hypothetical protein
MIKKICVVLIFLLSQLLIKAADAKYSLLDVSADLQGQSVSTKPENKFQPESCFYYFIQPGEKKIPFKFGARLFGKDRSCVAAWLFYTQEETSAKHVENYLLNNDAGLNCYSITNVFEHLKKCLSDEELKKITYLEVAGVLLTFEIKNRTRYTFDTSSVKGVRFSFSNKGSNNKEWNFSRGMACAAAINSDDGPIENVKTFIERKKWQEAADAFFKEKRDADPMGVLMFDLNSIRDYQTSCISVAKEHQKNKLRKMQERSCSECLLQ